VRHHRKRPITVTGRAASSTDPETWSTYTAAKSATVGHGLGFVLGDGIACLDLDHCLIDGKPNGLAREVLARVPGAYVEVSPSGDGLHVWGTAPEQPGRRRDGFEVYSVGRYITVTGNVFRPGRLVDLSEFF
jgi:primase-polymerase (primpol)-like protein